MLFGPEVSTASRANLGGMIGNNSAGSRSIVYGKTLDHVRRLGVVLADGSRASFGPVRLADWEKVNFKNQSAHLEKGKEIGPPTPISPANMMPLFVSQDPKPVEFSWTPMANAKGYRLRISKNPYFSSTIVDRTVKAGDLLRAASSVDKKLITAVTVFDVYEGKGIEDGKKSIAIAVTLQPREKTMTDQEI